MCLDRGTLTFSWGKGPELYLGCTTPYHLPPPPLKPFLNGALQKQDICAGVTGHKARLSTAVLPQHAVLLFVQFCMNAKQLISFRDRSASYGSHTVRPLL